MKRRQFIQYTSAGLGAALITSPSIRAQGKLDKITFGTNWFAQAEHGGFYQAVATGIYKKYGLEVTIKMGGPQTNGTQLLMGGAVDFFMGSGADGIKAVEAGIPKVTVASIFQKDPQILVAHPGAGYDTFKSLNKAPIFISGLGVATFWPFLKAQYDFKDELRRPYNFSVAPFLRDKTSVQQGYVSSEPLIIQKEGGFQPVVYLLADNGYNPYASTIETRREFIEKNPDLVQRFVDASIEGWYSYLENPQAGNQLIKKDNPQMSDEVIAYSIKSMQQYGIVMSGEAATKGIGIMTKDRWQSFFEVMSKAGVFKPDTDYTKAFTLEFINKKPQGKTK